MTELTVRRLLVDLEAPLERHWNGGDAFRTAFFDALSMSFPSGEQFFIDSVRMGLKALPADRQAAFADEVQGFVGQEATHRRMHSLYNEHLARQGLVNTWEPRALRRLKRLDGFEARHWVGATAAVEHITAVFSVHLLTHTDALDGADDRMRTLWQWHASEECEHRSTAFDLYRALDGNEKWRLRWMRIVTFNFALDLMRQTVRNLHDDGTLWRWSTWRSGAQFLFGRGGLLRSIHAPWRAYFRPDFHPRQQGGELGEDWLREHGEAYRAVGRSL